MHYSLRTKLILPVLIAVVFMVILGAIGLLSLNRQEKQVSAIFTSSLERYQFCSEQAITFSTARTGLFQLLSLARNNASAARMSADTKALRDNLESVSQALKKTNAPTAAAGVEKYSKEARDALDLLDVDINMAAMMADSTAASYESAAKSLHDLLEDAQKQANEAKVNSQRANNNISLIFLVIFAAALILSVGAAAWIGKNMMHELKKLIQGLRLGGEGDLRNPIDVRSHDELENAAESFNGLRSYFIDLIRQIRAQIDKAGQQTRRMTENTQSIANSFEKQGEATRATAAEVEEVSTSISHIAAISHAVSASFGETHKQTDIAYKSAELATASTERISSAIIQLGNTMQELRTASGEIHSIVKVIREIADQTNLLALNAAIEAARAGEQGRGFAVVADEVRKLAERTSAATVEITRKITSIVTRADSAHDAMLSSQEVIAVGRQQSLEIQDVANRIRLDTEKTLKEMQELAQAIQEQDTAMHSIAIHIETISHQTEQAQEMVDQNRDRAEQLYAEILPLDEIVQRFKV